MERLELVADRDTREPLPREQVDAIVREFRHAGATCKVSSIHVNGWYGAFDKLEGCRRFVRDRWGAS